jgi:hypothetical protein
VEFAQERWRERTARYQLDDRDVAKDMGAGEPTVEKPEGRTLQDELEWTRKQLELERLRMRALQSTSHGDSRSHPRR